MNNLLMTPNIEDRIRIKKKLLSESMCRLLEDVFLMAISDTYGFSGDPDEFKRRFIGSVSDCVDMADELVKLRIKQSREDDFNGF